MAANGFVGRRRELAVLSRHLDEVVQGLRDGSERPGRCILLRGRRRVGKSRLIEEYRRISEAPGMFYTAVKAAAARQLDDFTAAASADLHDGYVFAGTAATTWTGAFTLLGAALPDDRPSIVVMDEVPYLMDEQGHFESELQRAWDTQLSRKPVLLILVGSDISMMKALNTYDRPFHQRGVEIVLHPLNPAEVGRMVGLTGADAFDAALLTGGLPKLCASWQNGEPPREFLTRSVASDSTVFANSAALALGAEFPDDAMARTVLTALGSGEREFSAIGRAAGGMSQTTLKKALDLLIDKRMVAVETPLSTVAKPKLTRYRIADPYLRFWLRFIGPHLAEIERGRPDLVLNRIEASWTSWRGKAVEPILREAVERLLPLRDVPSVGAIGGYWNRESSIEVDLVGADRAPMAKQVLFAGSAKWRDNAPFGRKDYDALATAAGFVTGFTTGMPLVGISRSGFDAGLPLNAALGPAELLDAWEA